MLAVARLSSTTSKPVLTLAAAQILLAVFSLLLANKYASRPFSSFKQDLAEGVWGSCAPPPRKTSF